MNIKCLVLDDEPLACKFLEDCIAKIELLELVGSCTSAMEALNVLQRRSIDLLFLDIQMPEINGLELLRSLNNPPRVIMTTAYDDFAVASYELNVIDYLLKPFSFARFLKAVDKLSADYVAAQSSVEASQSPVRLDHIFVNHNGVIVRLDLADIYFFKGLGDYVSIRTEQQTLTIRDQLKRIEFVLAQSDFVRVHKSYIVSTSRIESIKGTQITILGETISVGGLYRNQFLHEINRRRIG